MAAITQKSLEVLGKWETTNTALRGASEEYAQALLEAEKNGKRRVQVLLRCHARYNRLRANRERSELLSMVG
jgi:hypothetical protein